MTRAAAWGAGAVALWVAIAPSAHADEPYVSSLLAPSIHHALLEPVAVAEGSLEATVSGIRRRATERSWIAWSVPGLPGTDGCCWQRRRRGCCLEGERRGVSLHRTSGRWGPHWTAPPDQADLLLVLLRVSGGQIDRVTAYSSNCPLDAAGMPLYWLGGVEPAESVGYLASLLDHPRIGEEALAPLALHRDPRAEERLVERARRAERSEAREDALFWLAQRGGERVEATLLEAVAEDPDPDVREHAVFALSQLPEDAGTLLLLDLAGDRSLGPDIRNQAIFWLAQSEDPRALDLLTGILRRATDQRRPR